MSMDLGHSGSILHPKTPLVRQHGALFGLMKSFMLLEQSPRFTSLNQGEFLLICPIRIPCASQLTTGPYVFAGPAQYRPRHSLTGAKLSGSRRIIGGAQSDNLILTTAKREKQN